jgi:hypothetical protein
MEVLSSAIAVAILSDLKLIEEDEPPATEKSPLTTSVFAALVPSASKY